jgi:hydroxymethylpyrimidine pyrophosphatase-like HAD family hydrolase
MRPAALILDIDGTIRPRYGATGRATVAAICAWREAGLPLALATARGQRAARAVLGELAWLVERGVFHNGAAVCDAASGLEQRRCLPVEIVQAVWPLVQAQPGAVMNILGDDERLACSVELSDQDLIDWGLPRTDVRPFAEGLLRPAVKLSLWSRDGGLGDLAQRIAATGLPLSVRSADGGHCVFVNAPGCDKGTGARALMHALGWDPHCCAAVGDDATDVPLLEAVGHRIGVAGGHPALLALAGAVVPPPEADGLAQLPSCWTISCPT